MELQEIMTNKRQDILTIAVSNGATQIGIFGSVVRGESKEDSDIDFLVELEKNRSLFDLIELKYQLEELLGVPVDVVTKKFLHQMIREKVLSEVVLL